MSYKGERCPSLFFECQLVRRTRTKKKGLVARLRSEASQESGVRLCFSSAKLRTPCFINISQILRYC